MLTGAWAAGRVEGMDPDFDFVVAPYPVLEDGGLVVINADTRLSVNRASEHIDEALAFVEFFTRSENIQKFADQQSSFSPLRDGIPSSVKRDTAHCLLLPVRKDGHRGRMRFWNFLYGN